MRIEEGDAGTRGHGEVEQIASNFRFTVYLEVDRDRITSVQN
ncbi:hypothetical protein [Chlorogloeopsis sp. ULAP02]